MKFAVFTVMLPDLTPEEAATELKAAGYDGVEWRFTVVPEDKRSEAPSFWGNNLCTFAPTPEEAERARKIADGAGLAIPGLGTYLKMGDINGVEEVMQLAQICGAPCIRVATGWLGAGMRYTELFDENRAYLREVEAVSKDTGVKGLVEIHHNSIASSASLAARLVDGFDPGNIGVIHDAGNMAYEGYEAYRIGLELLGPYLAHVHLKNATFHVPASANGTASAIGKVWRPTWAPMDDGVVDFEALFTALIEAGYNGWMSFEDFSNARPVRQALRHNLSFIKGLLAQVQA